jgi:hypothetical protein
MTGPLAPVHQAIREKKHYGLGGLVNVKKFRKKKWHHHVVVRDAAESRNGPGKITEAVLFSRIRFPLRLNHPTWKMVYNMERVPDVLTLNILYGGSHLV